ncbi:hypothetical protein [Gimesia panareensis]|uniref:Uncharacterized protein n=1 Tax=Gimesia panareensis TaxID=2527978 RepID=A0A518A1M6_9PLAN|nr:hypothetical protein [Gimesia panareensis]QDT25675.1 hypothetical protein Enr10x_09720 [Gimesia panareensis]QDU48620.1 hypothetical protein Pan110_09350 [Gimesia panareensis]QDV18227.1 hypothetical protein Pan153_28840 [Gimesia panareensis]
MSEENEEFEEITSEEVDRVVAALESLIESTDSENIRSYLEEAMNEIYYLVYEDEEGEEEWDSSVEACDESDEDFSDAA